MFGIFNKKPDFEKIFSSQSEIYKYIYGDRGRTSAILGDNSFIDAWLSSRNIGNVTSVINDKALEGDIPSLKQMIWLCEAHFGDVENRTNDANQALMLKTKYMQDRVMFCQRAIECGLIEQSYYAMTSSAKLYLLRSNIPGSIDDQITRSALAGIIKYANIFIKSGNQDKELIDDAKSAIEHYGPLGKILGAI
ncbi:MAG: hypothetical protein ABI668_07780 [Sphingorhabdus sp.]